MEFTIFFKLQVILQRGGKKSGELNDTALE